MAGRRRKSGPQRPKRAGGFRLSRRGFRLLAFLVVQGVLVAWMGALYVRQPDDVRQEIRLTVRNYLRNTRRIRLWELLEDVRRVCRVGDAVRAAVRSGDVPAYGGVPRVLGWTRRRGCQTLNNIGYWCGYDNEVRNPVWVAYTLQDGVRHPVGDRPVGFETDRRTRARVTSADYVGCGFDRGHLAPNFGIARSYGGKAQLETFLMSNICPQRHDLNAGLWKDLEMRECGSYLSRFQRIWVFAGPVFDPQVVRELPSGIPIPAAFYKIIVDEMAGRVMVTAYIIPQQLPPRARLSDFLTSVNEIERRTGIDFFPDFSEEDQERIESAVAPKAW